MNKIACPINSVKNERRFYKQEIAKLTKKIKALYSKDIPPYSETLSLLDKRRRVAYQCKPADIFRNLDSGGFYIPCMPGHSKKQKNEWVCEILHQNQWGERPYWTDERICDPAHSPSRGL